MATNNLDPREWLADRVINNVSFALRDNTTDKTKDRQTYLLYDGTIITIDRSDRMAIGNALINDLSNPNNIRVKGKCAVVIEYDDPILGEKQLHTFEVNGIANLEKQWNSFKRENGIDQDAIGTLNQICFTQEQRELISKLESTTNDLLNLLQDTNIKMSDMDPKELKCMDRKALINFILTTIGRLLVQCGISKKAHLPYAIKGLESKDPVEVCEYVDEYTFLEE